MTLKADIKDIDEKILEDYLQGATNSKKAILKEKLRVLLFGESLPSKDLKSMGFEDQIDFVFADLDRDMTKAIQVD